MVAGLGLSMIGRRKAPAGCKVTASCVAPNARPRGTSVVGQPSLAQAVKIMLGVDGRLDEHQRSAHHFTADEDGQKMRIYLTKACRTCPLKDQCTTANERRIKRWEHEHVVEAAQTRLDQNPQAMRVRRETVEHPFGTLKMRMGATHFLMKTLPKVATEMALHVLAYNLTRVMNIVGIKPLLVAIRA
jgi:Transposase DDE domain